MVLYLVDYESLPIRMHDPYHLDKHRRPLIAESLPQGTDTRDGHGTASGIKDGCSADKASFSCSACTETGKQ
jgi:hypothetical protein